MTKNRACQYTIFKIKGRANFGAMRLSLNPVSYDERGYPKRGCIFVDIAPKREDKSDGDRVEWDDKVTFALYEDDIGKILCFIDLIDPSQFKRKTEDQLSLEIFHDTNAGKNGPTKPKILSLTRTKGKSSIFVNMSFNKQNIGLPVSQPELQIIKYLLISGLRSIMGW